MNSIEAKKSFMLASGQTVRDTPGEPTVEERKLNLALILEEVYELARDGYGMEGEFQAMMDQKVLDNVRPLAEIRPGEYHYKRNTLTYDPVATLDALVDLRVVCDGPILSSGLQGVWEAANAEVAASNMSKFTTDAQQAIDFATTTPGAYMVEENNGFWCVKNDAGKVMKGNWHFKPNLKAVYEAGL